MEAPLERQVTIKGIREGLLVTMGTGSFPDILGQLHEELSEKRDFLRGSKMVLQVGGWLLQRRQLVEIRECFEQLGLTLWTVLADEASTRVVARDLGLATRLPGSHTDLEGNVLPEHNPSSSSPVQEAIAAPSATNSDGLLLKETLRSGRSVYHEGHVVIIGDVNPGAEVIAGGDVIVWGKLRGLVHAGALGDETAVICALSLNPTQLRIANHIAVPPDERDRQPTPEQALIRSDQIIAEPWQFRN